MTTRFIAPQTGAKSNTTEPRVQGPLASEIAQKVPAIVVETPMPGTAEVVRDGGRKLGGNTVVSWSAVLTRPGTGQDAEMATAASRSLGIGLESVSVSDTTSFATLATAQGKSIGGDSGVPQGVSRGIS